MATPIPVRESRWWWLLLTPLLGALAWGVVSIVTIPGPAPDGDRSGADQVCRTQVLGKLRAPGTAQFSDATVSYKPGETADFYTARGAVDAQNGFGALLRMRYECDLVLERDLVWRVTNVIVA
jgi:hypothetical protein